MADVRPFRGIRYDVAAAEDAARVVSPPYDVIDEAMQDALYAAHPANVVRVIQGRTTPQDDDRSNRYTRAAADYAQWLADGTLTRDAEGFYVYVQDFEVGTPSGPVRKQRIGVIGLVRIQPFGQGDVLPHEHTMPAPKADRLELMRHTSAAFGQIFSLYSDPENRTRALMTPVMATEPLYRFGDAHGIDHRLWQVTDDATVSGFRQLLADRPLFIADGHHRYETAVAYRDERLGEGGGAAAEKAYGYNMQTMVNMDDEEGMAINPIHRVVVDLDEAESARLDAGLADYFDFEEQPMESVSALLGELTRRGKERPTYGYCTGDGKTVRYLSLKPEVDPAGLDSEGRSAAWRGLSTGLLQLVLGRALGLDEAALTEGNKVRFVKSDGEVLTLLQEAPGRAGFFLNSVGMDQLREVVLAGERMPPKSTFFHPKVFSGIVIQDLDAF